MKSKKWYLTAILIFSAGCSAGENSSLSMTEPAGRHGTEISPELDAKAFKLDCVEAQFIKILNLYRMAHGLKGVRLSRSGMITARWHAQDMINKNYFSHTEPDGRTFFDRAVFFGYPSHAENIAAGNDPAAAVFCQWKNSPSHNANMLGSQHESTGIGHASGGGQYHVYWSNGFGSKTTDEISEPLTSDSSCLNSVTLPTCL